MTVKTILLTLLLTGFGLGAQTPPTVDPNDAASRDAILRRAMREASASLVVPATTTNNVARAATTNTTAASGGAVPAVTPVVLAAADPVVTPEKPIASVAPGKTTNKISRRKTQSSTATNAPTATVAAATMATTGSATVTTTNGAALGPLGTPAVPMEPIPVVPTFSTTPAATATTTPVPAPQAVPPPQSAPAIPSFSAVPTAVPVVPPPPAKPAEPVIPAGNIDFPAAPLEQVLTVYGDLVGRTILRPAALPAQTITLKTQTPLTRTEAIQALDSVLAMNGITMMNVGDKFVKAVPMATAFQEANRPNMSDKDQLPEAAQYMTRIVPIKYAKPSELVQTLQGFAKIPNAVLAVDSSQILVIRDYAENVKRMLELIEQIDVTVPLDYESEVIPIKYALASDIASALGSLGGGTGTTVGHNSNNGAAGGPAGSRLGSGGGMGSSGGIGSPGTFGSTGNNGYQPGGMGSQGGVSGVGGGGTAGGSRTTSFSDRLRQIVNKAATAGDFQVLGQTKIIADERTNSLLVFASKQDMEMIKNIIGKLDVVLAQVLIEAIIMEVKLTDAKSIGISYLQKNPSQVGSFNGVGAINNGAFLNPGTFQSVGTNLTSGLTSGLNYFARFGGDFEATLTAAANDDRVNILSNPSIQTSHAVTASLQIGETVPYVTGTYFNGINGSPSSQYQQVFVGINLQVTPLINPDGLVVMDIVQDIQDIDGATQIDANLVPNTSKRTASAKVSVRDRDTIILGGFISTHKEKAKSGVPFLKDIPVLGYLFNSSSAKNTRQELVVLIRPTVLPTPEAAALVATSRRNNSPAIKSAEAEYRADEIKGRKQADKIKMPKE